MGISQNALIFSPDVIGVAGLDLRIVGFQITEIPKSCLHVRVVNKMGLPDVCVCFRAGVPFARIQHPGVPESRNI